MNLINTVIVSHDAGGAFLLAKWCRQWDSRASFKYYLKGPAVDVFNEVMPSIEIVEFLDLDNVECVITSTGWQTDFELNAIKKAKRMGVFVVSYLDHWANYPSRFIGDNSRCLPDELWLADTEAMKIAHEVFSNDSINFRYIRNRHLSELKRDVKSHTLSSGTLLICLEPIRNGYSYQYAYEALNLYLVKNYTKGKTIIIRDHPSGLESQSRTLIKYLNVNFKVVSSNDSLSFDIARAEAIFGYQSSVLAYACEMGIPALSYYPVALFEPILPHKSICYI